MAIGLVVGLVVPVADPAPARTVGAFEWVARDRDGTVRAWGDAGVHSMVDAGVERAENQLVGVSLDGRSPALFATGETSKFLAADLDRRWVPRARLYGSNLTVIGTTAARAVVAKLDFVGDDELTSTVYSVPLDAEVGTDLQGLDGRLPPGARRLASTTESDGGWLALERVLADGSVVLRVDRDRYVRVPADVARSGRPWSLDDRLPDAAGDSPTAIAWATDGTQYYAGATHADEATGRPAERRLGSQVTATAPDGRERVVVAAPDAGCRPRTEGDRVLAEPITAIAVDGSGNVWFATDEDRTSPVGRMLVVDPDRRLRVVPASVGPIVEMAIGADGDLYAVERHRATPRVLRLPDAADRVADYAIADRSPGC